jgi:hypothetical protein
MMHYGMPLSDLLCAVCCNSKTNKNQIGPQKLENERADIKMSQKNMHWAKERKSITKLFL